MVLKAREIVQFVCTNETAEVDEDWREVLGLEEFDGDGDEEEEELLGDRGVGREEKRGRPKRWEGEDLGEDAEDGGLICPGCQGLI